MFDWLRRRRQIETPEAAEAARMRAPATVAGDAALATVLFPTDLYPSDGGTAHHAGGAPCDAGHGFGCDGGGSHH